MQFIYLFIGYVALLFAILLQIHIIQEQEAAFSFVIVRLSEKHFAAPAP